MSMLAEPKRKVKYSLNPRGHIWANDESKFGQKMLEKMGWSKGKGLGKNEDGMKEHVKTSYHFNTEGLGYKEKDNLPEISYEYEQLLSKLNKKVEKRKKKDKKVVEEEEVPKDSPRREIKIRHRYKRVREAKDASNYSEQDLKTILATKPKLDEESVN